VGYTGGSAVTERIYRKQIRPILLAGAETLLTTSRSSTSPPRPASRCSSPSPTTRPRNGSPSTAPPPPCTCKAGEFDRIYHLLQTEAPLFFSALNLFGLRAFNLSTSTELPGEGPADDDALAQLAARIRQHAADSQAPDSDKQGPVP
jgi:hypothetical protein